MASIDCVSCRESNVFTISGSRVVRLLGSCENCPETPQYEWTVTRDDGLQITLDSSTSTTGSNGANLVIRNGVLNDNHTFTFSLRISARGFWSSGYSKLIMVSSLPPSSGQCHIHLNDTVVALQDVVHTVCHGWTANSNMNSMLIYHVYVQDTKSHGGYKEWYPLYRGTQNEVSFYLSPFDDEEGLVNVIIEVIDAQGIKTLAIKK